MIETLYIIFFILFFILYKYLNYNEIIYIEGFDSKSYLVRNLPDKEDAAELLAYIRNTLIKFINDLYHDIKNDIKTDDTSKNFLKYIKTIKNRLPNSIIKESSAKSEYTSYSINKGEELVFCLRSKNTNKLHDINDLLYVAIHEIAHIGCPEIGHTELFKKINKYLLKEAINYKIYRYDNYGKNNKEYCGIILTNNILDNYYY
jgi:hypothetical protein